MGWYNVVEPCVVGQLHYARPTDHPIDLDDEVAAPLVEAGNLTPYPTVEQHPDGWPDDAQPPTDGPYADPPAESPAPPTRGRRRTEG